MMPSALADSAEPLRIAIVGAGNMGRRWVSAVERSDAATLSAIVDLDGTLAAEAAQEAGTGVIAATSIAEAARRTGIDAVVNVTVPRAHNAVNAEALDVGLPVLCEKPIAPTVAEAVTIARHARRAGRLLMTSQSRRYYRTLAAFRSSLADIGPVGVLTTEFFRAPRFGGFREEMAHVLLVDMAIHAFDVARHLLDADPVSVYCEEFNPSWSWYSRDAAAVAQFEMSDGTRFVYTGSWCSPGAETSWNGVWRASGEHGTATWDGEAMPAVDGVQLAAVPSAAPEEIDGSLADFIDALRTGRVPDTEVHANIRSLAMVESAIRSAESGARVRVADVISEATRTADVAAALR